MGVCRALALFGDAKQAMGEKKSGQVKAGLTRPVAMALGKVVLAQFGHLSFLLANYLHC